MPNRTRKFFKIRLFHIPNSGHVGAARRSKRIRRVSSTLRADRSLTTLPPTLWRHRDHPKPEREGPRGYTRHETRDGRAHLEGYDRGVQSLSIATSHKRRSTYTDETAFPKLCPTHHWLCRLNMVWSWQEGYSPSMSRTREGTEAGSPGYPKSLEGGRSTHSRGRS
jgi:hypothetical protein